MNTKLIEQIQNDTDFSLLELKEVKAIIAEKEKNWGTEGKTYRIM